MPLLFWAILFYKRTNGVEDRLNLLEDPAYAKQKENLREAMQQELANQGTLLTEQDLKTYESLLMASYLRDKQLNVSAAAWLV